MFYIIFVRYFSFKYVVAVSSILALFLVDYVYHIGSEIIDIVQNYTYQGTRISSSRNSKLSLERLRQKALHAFFGL